MKSKTDQAASRSKTEREVAMDILTRVDKENAYSNLLLNQTLQKGTFERQSSAFITELVYGTIQRLNTLDYFLNRFVSKGVHKLDPWVRNLLRLSMYQLMYLDRVPEFAAVNEAVNIAKRKGHKGISGMVNGVLRNVIRQKASLSVPDTLPADEYIALSTSHPRWLVRRWIRQYGEETTRRMCEANNAPPHVSVRVNALQCSREALIEQFSEQDVDITASPVSPSGVIAKGIGNMAHHEGFTQGLFTIQDESSMLVAEALQPEPGMTVLDCCAAPGGKTTHIAEKMQDTGEIWANDVHEHKRTLIEDQAQRLQLTCIRTLVSDAMHLKDRFQAGQFDRVLLDAPCSGLGVIRRKPDLKWQKDESEIQSIQSVQADILDHIADLVKPGGVLVYSTCTLEYEENQQNVLGFLKKHPEFELDEALSDMLPEAVVKAQEQAAAGMIQILPHYFHSDGFFIARLRKKA